MTRPALREPVNVLRDQNGDPADEVTLASATTYYYRVDTTQWDRIGLGAKWSGGTATVTVFGCIDRRLVDKLGVIPGTGGGQNPWLVQLTASNQFATVPAGSASSELLVIAFHGLDAIVVEVNPSVDVTEWGLRALLREGSC